MKSFKEINQELSEAKSEFFKDVVYELKSKKNAAGELIDKQFFGSDYAIKFSHIGTSIDLTKQSLVFMVLNKVDDMYIPTGDVLTLLPEHVKKTNKMFIKAKGPVNKWIIK